MQGHFFIVGSGRCGSRFLRNLLMLHSHINICIQTEFIPTLYDLYGSEPITFEQYFSVIDEHYDSRGNKYTRIMLNSQCKRYDGFKEDFATFCGNMEGGNIVNYTERLQEYLYGEGDYLIGDRTPAYGTIMTTLKELWPNAKFIHLLRDGVYASQSMIQHPGFVKFINGGVSPTQLSRCLYKGRMAEYSSEPVNVKDAAHFWEAVVVKTLEEARAIPSSDYCEIKYEDLVRIPMQTLTNIARFLNSTPDKKWLKEASLLPKPFFLNRIKRRMSKEEYQDIAAEIWKTMQLLGYPLEDSYYSGVPFKELWRSLRYGNRKVIDKKERFMKKIRRRIISNNR